MLVATIMGRFSLRVAVLSMLLLYLFRSSVAVGSTTKIVCKDGEREALLKFKGNLYDDHGHLSSWGKEEEKRECCQWVGIQCDNKSGHVISLDLSPSGFQLRGKTFNSSLIELHYLSYLDLRAINFSGNQIPSFFGEMTSLEYLYLRSTNLDGSIPETFGNMTALVDLDLSYNKLEGEIWKSAIWSICTLRRLYLNANNFRGVQVPSELSDHESFFKCTNYSLEVLNLNENSITGLSLNPTLFSSLKELRLKSNKINGSVPESFGQLSNLELLDLGKNSITGFFAKPTLFSSLRELLLSSNQINGSVPESVGHLSNLEILDLSRNSITGFFPNPTLFSSLRVLWLGSNQINGSVPESVGQLSNLEILDLSNNSITGCFPNPTLFSSLRELYRSSNQINGSIPESVGQLSYLEKLEVSRNQLSGTVSNCWSNFKNLKVLNLAYNKLSGNIPTSIGSLTQIQVLDLRNNNFNGELPITLKNCSELVAIDVGHNKLSGPIPSWIGESLTKLAIVVLRSNQLFGSIPSSMCHLQYLQLLDLSTNHISGNIPICVGNFPEMRKTGSVVSTITYFYMNANASDGQDIRRGDVKEEIVWKGTLSEFETTLGLVKSIDLSCNALEGEIPREITQLVGLVSLHLSRNDMSGQIPLQIGNMKSLDALDLSDNHFSGHIPSSLGLIDRLGVLNLSDNNLSRKIPIATQLQRRDASSYMGNPGLCGAPLDNKFCPGEEPFVSKPTSHETGSEDEDEDEFISQGFYASMGAGLVVGFWGFVGTLLFNKTWRLAYLKFLNGLVDWIYVIVAVHKRKFLTALRG